MRILDHLGAVLREEHDQGQLERPEVDRGQLRDLLIDSLPDGTLHWNHKATALRDVDGAVGRRAVEFVHGETITTDLLIGADGAWSRVRPLLTDARPTYSGISFVEADLLDGTGRHPDEAVAMGPGMLFAFRDDTGILGHTETDGTLHVYLGFRVPEDWVDTIDFADTALAKRSILDRLDGWDDALRGLVANADTPLTPRRIHALPVGIRWDRVPGVTLLSDAAHLMSPFAGEGANLALYDGPSSPRPSRATPTMSRPHSPNTRRTSSPGRRLPPGTPRTALRCCSPPGPPGSARDVRRDRPAAGCGRRRAWLNLPRTTTPRSQR